MEQVQAPSILDRAAGCVVAVVSVGITILALPIVIAANSFFPFNPARLYSVPMIIWAGAVCAVAGVIGLRVGTPGVIELLGHLWGTGWPENKTVTGRLWLGVMLLGGVTFLVALW